MSQQSIRKPDKTGDFLDVPEGRPVAGSRGEKPQAVRLKFFSAERSGLSASAARGTALAYLRGEPEITRLLPLHV